MITFSPQLSGNKGRGTIQGFTLFELVVALTIVAILVTVAVPGMRQLIDSNRLTAYINSAVGGANLARSEAIKQNREVAFCAGFDGCGGDWSSGWTVRDADGGVLASSSNEFSLIRASGNVNVVQFDGEGLPSNGLEVEMDVEGIAARKLVVSPAGSVRSDRVDD